MNSSIKFLSSIALLTRGDDDTEIKPSTVLSKLLLEKFNTGTQKAKINLATSFLVY